MSLLLEYVVNESYLVKDKFRKTFVKYLPSSFFIWIFISLFCFSLYASEGLDESLSTSDLSQLDADAKHLISIASTLNKEHRDYLLYLFARLNRPEYAEALANVVLKNNPKDKNSLLVMASMYK
jgi:hypothetical protein